jgi:hypothetical protein
LAYYMSVDVHGCADLIAENSAVPGDCYDAARD